MVKKLISNTFILCDHVVNFPDHSILKIVDYLQGEFDADHSTSISLKFALHVAPLAYTLVIVSVLRSIFILWSYK